MLEIHQGDLEPSKCIARVYPKRTLWHATQCSRNRKEDDLCGQHLRQRREEESASQDLRNYWDAFDKHYGGTK